jgi:hypothetical protein
VGLQLRPISITLLVSFRKPLTLLFQSPGLATYLRQAQQRIEPGWERKKKEVRERKGRVK